MYVVVNLDNGPGWAQGLRDNLYILGEATIPDLEDALSFRDLSRREYRNPALEVFELIPPVGWHPTLLRDALYYLSPRSGASIEEARGVLVGVVTTVMHFRRALFTEAFAEVRKMFPQDFRIEAVPEGWRADLEDQG